MFKNYERMYIEERGEKEFYKNMKDYYKKLLNISTEQINCYRKQIDLYEKDHKKMRILSHIGLGCGIASLLIIIIRLILKVVIR